MRVNMSEKMQGEMMAKLVERLQKGKCNLGELSRKTGLTYTGLSRLRKGHTKDIKLSSYEKIFNALGGW